MTTARDEVTTIVVVVLAFVAVHLTVAPPLWLVGVGILGAIATFHPYAVVLVLLLTVSVRTHDEVQSLEAVPSRPIAQEVLVLRTDPVERDSTWTVEVELEGDRLFASARSHAAAVVSEMAAGDQIVASGTVRGRSPSTNWSLSRRIVGVVDISQVHDAKPAGGVTRLANGVRENIRSGARSLPDDLRALFTGLVFGDDRDQTIIAADNFRAAGLGHLLAVSGQNVLFVLVVAAPVVSRVRSTGRRVALTIVVLSFFGFMTRFEPSVTRALVMAGVATFASSQGRPTTALNTLPVAVVGLLLFDPLLGRSLAFQLSVAATSGLVVLTPRISEAISGEPGPVTTALGATVGAQLAVAPLLLITFGSVSPVAIPANLLAGPAAAAVMMWGLTIGTLAGYLPETAAAIVHAPTHAAIWWIDRVATVAAAVPSGRYTFTHLGVIVGGGWLFAMARRSGCGPLVAAPAAVVLAAAMWPLVAVPSLGPGEHRLAEGATLFRSSDGHDVLVIDPDARADELITEVRLANVGRIDLVVASAGSRPVGRTVRTVTERFDVIDLWAPVDHQVPGARVAPFGISRLGDVVIEHEAGGSLLVRPWSSPGGTIAADGPDQPDQPGD